MAFKHELNKIIKHYNFNYEEKEGIIDEKNILSNDIVFRPLFVYIYRFVLTQPT